VSWQEECPSRDSLSEQVSAFRQDFDLLHRRWGRIIKVDALQSWRVSAFCVEDLLPVCLGLCSFRFNVGV
jgi:hypothetical protein